MLRVLVAITVMLSASDHWTTYLCLRQPVAGVEVIEANPMAAWLFTHMGLVEGLLFDSVLTLFALTLLLTTRLIPHPVKLAFLTVVIAGTGYAVVNNLGVLSHIGLDAFGNALGR